jgi:type 1 glutamine amidotransferase
MWFIRPTATSSASSGETVKRLALALLAMLLMLVATATPSAAQPRPLRVLYLSQSVGFVHETVRRPSDGLASSELALQAMGRESGVFTVELTQDARDITSARLADLDVLVFSTTGALPIDRPTWEAVLAWIESGRGGFVGIHSAADTALAFEGGEAAYTAFLGGRFDGHPWTQGTAIGLSTLEPGHPLVSMWPDRLGYAEEIYQYAGFDPTRVRVLQTLDMRVGPLRRPYPVPVSWVRQIGDGRLFYTNLGHTPSTWDDPRFRAQIVEAIRWAGHRVDASAEPNPGAQDQAATAAFAAAKGVSLSATPWNLTEIATRIRALQALHPEKHDGDATAWDAAVARLSPERP